MEITGVTVELKCPLVRTDRMVDHGYVLPTRGLVLDSDGSQDQVARAESCAALARTAESIGFTSVWAGDSVLAKPRLDPLTTLAAVAAETDAVDLGTAVHLPHLRRPVAVAQQAATVDLLSGGRLSLGVGVGSGDSVAVEHEQLGVPYERRGRVLDETLDVVRGLWNGPLDEYDGDFVTLEDADIGLRPPGELPVYVASATFDPRDGFPEPIRRRIADHGDGWLPIAKSPAMYADGIDRARDIVRDAGREESAFEAAYYQDVVIAETREAALDRARDFLAAYYPEWGELSDEQIERRGAFGPPSVVVEHLETYAEAGVETFVTRFASSDQRAQLRRFRELL